MKRSASHSLGLVAASLLGVLFVIPQARAYNGPTHALLFDESLEHLRRLGHSDAYTYLDELFKQMGRNHGEAVQWPDSHTTGRPDGNLADYVLCTSENCADVGDGDDERKNLDATRSCPYSAGEIRNSLISHGYSFLGSNAMATRKASAEHQYEPDSRVAEWEIKIQANCIVRLATIGPLHWKTAYDKVGEYAGNAIASANRCNAQPGFVWAARAMHFFQDLSCPNRTHVPRSLTFNVDPASLVIAALKNLSTINSMAGYVYYSDWVERNCDRLLWEIRAYPGRFPIALWPGDLSGSSRETLNTLARIAREWSWATDYTGRDEGEYERAAGVLLPTAVRIGAEFLYNYYERVKWIPPGAPLPPSHLTCSRAPPTNTLCWRDNSGNEDGFRIYEALGINCVEPKLLGVVGPNTTCFSWTSPGLMLQPPGPEPLEPQLCYIVEAFNLCGGSQGRLLDSCRMESPGCPYVASWNGAEFVEDNNILRVRRDDPTDLVDAPDHYLLRAKPVPCGDRYAIGIFERAGDRSDIDSVDLLSVDHDPAEEIAVTEEGLILMFKIMDEIPPAVPAPVPAESVSGIVVSEAEFQPNPTGPTDQEIGLLIETPPQMKSILRVEVPEPVVLPDEGEADVTWRAIGEVRTRENGGRSILPIAGNPVPFARPSPVEPLRFRFTGQVIPTEARLAVLSAGDLDVRRLDLRGAMHSALGEVAEWLSEGDGRIVPLGPGDEMVLQFQGECPPGGAERDFVLVAAGSYVLGSDGPAVLDKSSPGICCPSILDQSSPKYYFFRGVPLRDDPGVSCRVVFVN
jgi:hypothetical protein